MLPNPWAFASISLAWTKNWLKNFNATFPQLLCAHGMSPVRWDECLRNGIYISHVVLPTSYTYLTDTEFMTRQVLVQLGFRKRLDARWDCLPPSLSPALLLLAPSPFLFLALSLLSLLIWPHSQGGTSVVSHHHLSDTPSLSGMLLPSTPEWDPVCFVGSWGSAHAWTKDISRETQCSDWLGWVTVPILVFPWGRSAPLSHTHGESFLQ